ncbi:response regulator [Phenylobacterium sp.]|uniref:response regulator n=1 Tax=Phenylobacterium sp. TaxID=1871053 RepID=UPI0025FFA0D4|nr:response regulator [Phenylobacterium sp.]
MLEPTTDVAHPDGYIRYSRTVALTRLGLVGAFVMLLAAFTTWRMTALGVLEFGLYLALLVATEVTVRQRDRVGAARRLRRMSDVLMLALVVNACGLALQIRQYGQPRMEVEAALLTICVLLFAALRAHMSRLSYVAGVVPPALTLLWIVTDLRRPLAGNHYALAMLLFVVAVLLATSRQQETDRALTRAMQALMRKSLALGQAVEEAKAAGRARARLLAVASHEIRTPLNAVLGFGQALRRQPLTPEQATLARGVVEGGEQLDRLLDGILDLAGAGPDIQLKPAPLDLRGLVEAVVGVWRPHAASIGVDLAFKDADPGLEFGVVADAARLEQTLVTLVSGALKATSAGGRVSVRLAGAPRGEDLGVLVEVRDTGPPVPAEDRRASFEAFDQTARGRLVGDSGLGLSACAASLALMGGEVGVDDAPGGAGAVFWFAFNAPRHAFPAEGGETAVVGERTLRVLAAEDNDANRRVLAALLGGQAVDLTFAEDGAQAVAAWRAGGFDLLLMDANMPVMDGGLAVRAIRAAEPAGVRVPIWMVTANVSAEDIDGYLAAGADGVLRKPLDAAALFALLAGVRGS